MHAQDRSRMLQSRAQSFGSGQASFIFHPLRRLASLAVRAAAPSAGPASPWAPPWSGAVEASSARRASSPPAAGAGAACCGGGWGCAVAVLANSVPRLTRRLRTPENHKIIRSAFVSRDRSLVTTEAFKLLQALSQWNLAQCSLSRIDALAARGDLLLPNSQHEQNIKVRINFQTINKKN